MNLIIIDYQLSNLFSVKHACEHIGVKAKISSDEKDLEKADAAILPGVGAFGDAMKNLDRLGLAKVINKFIKSGKPFMGICLGMQLLFSESEEFGRHKGLNIIKGKVKKFIKKNRQIKVPQIGWNHIYPIPEDNNWQNSPFKNISFREFMYFVHSYYVDPVDKKNILSLTEYEGVEYCSSILHKNIFATQFHPEKSGLEGIKIYKNWINSIII